MLIACGSCQRQFDVGDHPPGAVLRCLCGTSLTVPAPQMHDARMLHCAACGAGLPDGATTCGFCQTTVALGQKGLGDACPACFARLFTDAKFCSACGTAIRPVAALKLLTDRACPRCSATLSECSTADTRFIECTSCGGLWLDEATVTAITQRRARDAAIPTRAVRIAGAVTRDPSADRQKVVYLKCPVCREPMHRKNFGRASGVVVDWCRGHGYWFDLDELDRVIAFIDAGGLDRQRAREIEELESKRRTMHMREAHRPAPGIFEAEHGATAFDFVSSLSTWLLRWLD